MAHVNLDLEDLTNAALRRLVKQLLTAKDGDEESILQKLAAKSKGKAPEKNDLADLHEQMHGKANAPAVEPDDGPDLEPDNDPDDSSMKKKGRKNG